MVFSYDKKACQRDREAAEWIDKEFDCSNYTDQHLFNALKFAKGCGGSESRARQRKLIKEINKRSRK